jgi:hypothetical protein
VKPGSKTKLFCLTELHGKVSSVVLMVLFFLKNFSSLIIRDVSSWRKKSALFFDLITLVFHPVYPQPVNSNVKSLSSNCELLHSRWRTAGGDKKLFSTG